MSKKILPLIGIVLLSASAVQGAVLFDNPYYPQGTGGGSLEPDVPAQSATAIILANTSTIQAFSITVQEVFTEPESVYTWSIYKDVNGMPSGAPGPISGVSGAPTYLPIVSGQAAMNDPSPGQSVFSWTNLVPGTNQYGWNAINEVTIKTGPVTLAAGDYFLALSTQGSEVGGEGWLSGAYNTGDVYSWVGAFVPVSAGGDAITVYGTSAPEIDPSSAIGGLTLLFGGLAVLYGRPPRPVA